jgi:uncharacterized protein (DUF2235 family)
MSRRHHEFETGFTNVARMFSVTCRDTNQLVYYDPGVGTMGARAAVTSIGQAATRSAGVAIGYGIAENIEQAYSWLCNNYRLGDQIYVFGYSRGAYTARALTGMLRTVGLLQADAGNLVPYARKLYADGGRRLSSKALGADAEKAEAEFWNDCTRFRETFGNPCFPNPWDKSRKQVRFLNLWDTVKFVGWLNLRARFEVARWPFTRRISNVDILRHAMALDERRRPFAVNRIAPEVVAESQNRFQEVWFAGVHGDIGGQNRVDSRLPDVALAWMVHSAHEAGLRINERRYTELLGVPFSSALPSDRATGPIVPNARSWWLAGGWTNHIVRDGDLVHPSVFARIEALNNTAHPYAPKNLRAAQTELPTSVAAVGSAEQF